MRIERVLLERLSLRGICRAVGITFPWLVGRLIQCVGTLPNPLHVQPVSCPRNVLRQRLEVEANAWASVVQQKAHQ